MSNCEAFIGRNINTGRGGYTPDEVAQLIRLAWSAAKRDQLTEQMDRLQGQLDRPHAGRASV